jgi:hypothetical protein
MFGGLSIRMAMSSTFLSLEPAQSESRHTFLQEAFEGLALCATCLITDELASYGAARKQIRLSIEHRQHKLDD